ncbi:MAG: hypothetical protein IKE91_05940 [Clostridia bacterium]|nr:hypothetical protein [Clostridia bacterium]
MITPRQDDVGKRIEIKYVPTTKKTAGKIISVNERMIALVTDDGIKVYVSFKRLKRYVFRII